ncbi:MAG: helix-turn-helix transcriptional regulator [Candidatus Anstonellales archaeon]
MRKFVFFVFAFCVVSAYNLYGEIYSVDSFENLENVVVEVSGPSSAKFVANNNYSVELPAGNYTIKAYYIENGRVSLYTKEEVVLNKDTEYDLILFYPSEFEMIPDYNLANGTFELPEKKNEWMCYAAIIVIGILVFIVGHVLSKGSEEEERGKPSMIKKEIDEDGKTIIKILKENEGRMEQKELREILKWTESKTSLVVGELEALGLVKRIKRGRKNIIKILGDGG